jgi:hypothetical protein
LLHLYVNLICCASTVRKPFPKEFRDDVVNGARRREAG